MKIHKIILSLLAAAAVMPGLPTAFLDCRAAPGSWRLHPTFDNNPQRIIATPFGAYFFGLAQEWRPNHADYATRQGFLYRYDADADELRFLSNMERLSETVVSTVEYNPHEKYLLAVYTSSNIDLIYDDGSVKNIPALRDADMNGSKLVNDITFDVDNHRAYLATDFGYVILNTERGEVDRSFIVSEPVESVARWQDEVLMLKDGVLYASKADRPRLSMSDFRPVLDLPSALRLLPINKDVCALQSMGDSGFRYYYIGRDDSGWRLNHIVDVNRPDVEYSDEGLTISSAAQFISITPSGMGKVVTRQEDDFRLLGSTRDMKEFWYAVGREGIYTKRFDADKETKWSLTRDAMMPEASSVYMASDMIWHPEYGLLVSNHGTDNNFSSYNVKTPVLLSALDNGRWVRHGLPYTNPSQASALYNPNGMAVDPDNSDLIYFGSIYNGILRIDLANPENVLHMGSSYDPSKNLPGYVNMGPGNPWWTDHFKFSAPQFDSKGNLWSGYYDSQSTNAEKNPQVQIWFWPAADRKASASAASFRPWKKWVVKGVSPSQTDIVLPLRHRDNENIIVYATNSYGGPVMVFDHKGTLDTEADDQRVMIDNPVNQDGTSVILQRVTSLYEDPDTGLVWVGTTTGLFTFSPSKIFASPNSVTNIKVSRDDGTELADYLFNGSQVNDMMVDPQGRKWFALHGGGVAVTSADGRRLLLELTSENSLLPSDIVYSLCYNPEAHSVMLSTDKGLAEYFPSGEGATGEDLKNVRAYPNPVRSDYFGYVTVDGLVDNALVKIVDAHGNLVKEFDLAANGEVKWDVTNMAKKRVKSGVYYILSSSGPGDSSLSNVGKILVVN